MIKVKDEEQNHAELQTSSFHLRDTSALVYFLCVVPLDVLSPVFMKRMCFSESSVQIVKSIPDAEEGCQVTQVCGIHVFGWRCLCHGWKLSPRIGSPRSYCLQYKMVCPRTVLDTVARGLSTISW